MDVVCTLGAREHIAEFAGAGSVMVYTGGRWGSINALGSRPASLFDCSPLVPVFAPPHQTICSTFSPCLRIWPILCTQCMTLARVVVGSGGGDILCCGSLIFRLMQLCNVLCKEGLRSSAVYLGDFPR